MSTRKPLLNPIILDPLNTINCTKPKRAKDKGPDSFIDREERAVAALLTRFKNLVTLAAMPAGEGAIKEIAAAHAFQMEVESNALVCTPPLRNWVYLTVYIGPSSGRPPPIHTGIKGALACGTSKRYR